MVTVERGLALPQIHPQTETLLLPELVLQVWDILMMPLAELEDELGLFQAETQASEVLRPLLAASSALQQSAHTREQRRSRAYCTDWCVAHAGRVVSQGSNSFPG